MDKLARVVLQRRREKSRAAGAPVLPDDLIPEILVRVEDGPALFRCAVACKQWRAIVADPSFLRHRWPESARDPSSFLGLFGQRQGSRGTWISGTPTFVSATPSPLSPFPGSFGPHTVSLLSKDYAVPLVSRQGLLLVHLFRSNPRGVHLAICNLFADTCELLPPLKCAFFGISGSAILTESDYCSNGRRQSPPSRYSNTFKVLLVVEERGTRKFNHSLYSFSSSESTWSAHRKDFVESISTLHSNTVVCRGKVHWLVRDKRLIWNLYTFELSNETIHVSLTEISIPHDQFEFNYSNRPLLNVTSNGNLSLLSLHTKCFHLDIWTRQDKKESGDSASDWLRTKVIELKPKRLCMDEMSCLCLCQRSGMVLILDSYNPMYIVNLKTEVIDTVSNQFCNLERHSVVPFEMDWPAFYMSCFEAETEGIKQE